MRPEAPAEPGRKKALTFTLLVHLALIGALFLGVQWKRSEPEAMQVELWSPTPQKATRVAPPEPAPAPEPKPKPEPKPEPPKKLETPKPPAIVVKEEKKKPEPKPEPPKPAPKPEAKPVAKPKNDPFKEMLERENRQRQVVAEQDHLAELADQAQKAAANRRGLEGYAAKIRTKVRGNIVLPPNLPGNPEAVFEVNQLPGGDVLSIRLKRSSGVPALDEAIERAIRKSSPLPKPDDPSQFQRTLEIKYKPFEE
ncbi:energy transducer TonB [Azonexus sp.]|uniref:energy transducer TonB n=1 Tax=Azonexus sp. TaxID=1872668 RepID=UPI0035B2070E